MERRSFLRSAVAGSLAATQAIRAGQPLPKRTYKDDVRLSIIGFGGIVVVGMEQPEANRWVAASYDRGVNYYDVAPSYWDGEAEIKLGAALEPYRKNVFLACKTGKRDAKGAREELERSLTRLKTDHFDLYQFHAVTKMDEVEQILGPGGAAETFLKAKQEGKVRYVGCSAHSDEAAIALMDRLGLDSILFPFNFALFANGFGPKALAHAKQKGVARLALKALCHRPWPSKEGRRYKKTWYEPIEHRELASRALRFTLSEDITAAIPPGEEKFYQMALDLGASFRPLSKVEREKLLAEGKQIQSIFNS